MPIGISSLAGGHLHQLAALVDTGATYTLVPREILISLGVRPEEKRPFALADGREAWYDLAWVKVELNGRSMPTIVIFGESASRSLLGAVTLEEFGLAVDPVNKRLIPVTGLLMSLHRQAA